MTFPLRYTVGHRVHSAGQQNEWGDPTQSWSEPVTKAVYGWGAPAGSDVTTAGDDRLVVEIELLVPPGFECDHRDRMILDGKEYEVISDTQNYDHNPLSDWNPGSVVNLRRVTG